MTAPSVDRHDRATVFTPLRRMAGHPAPFLLGTADVLSVHRYGDSVSATVYTPRSDDRAADELKRIQPETRIWRRHELVDLAVFTDTDVDLSDHDTARDRRVVDDDPRP